ncbi:MAG: ACT domain-containing protein [Methanobacteriota archaeon]|nr:MAG: ACT domain-containing protein [Euryarchaeota archaeon]
MSVTGVIIAARDRKGFLRDISTIIAAHDINITYVQQFLHDGEAQIYLELEDVEDLEKLLEEIRSVKDVISVNTYRPFEQIYGKRVIVIGGGAQVSQVVLGAVTEADRHNLRGERISVDTIPLVGEERLAEAIHAVGRLHRAAILVLAGSLMGGEVAKAVKELREEHGIPVISLNMAGSVPEVSDLVVTDPVQAGVMAVMAISETARFDLRKTGRRNF